MKKIGSDEINVEELDDLIHEIFSNKASELNNSPIEERIKFLLDEGIFDNEENLLGYFNYEKDV